MFTGTITAKMRGSMKTISKKYAHPVNFSSIERFILNFKWLYFSWIWLPWFKSQNERHGLPKCSHNERTFFLPRSDMMREFTHTVRWIAIMTYSLRRPRLTFLGLCVIATLLIELILMSNAGDQAILVEMDEYAK
jgi:hypothetical protein